MFQIIVRRSKNFQIKKWPDQKHRQASEAMTHCGSDHPTRETMLCFPGYFINQRLKYYLSSALNN